MQYFYEGISGRRCETHGRAGSICKLCAALEHSQLVAAGKALAEITDVIPLVGNQEFNSMPSARMVAILRFIKHRANTWNQ